MATENFIPEIWSGVLLRALETNLVYGQPGIINRDYEGDISQFGDTVRINSVGDPTLLTYTKNSDITAAEALTDAQSILTIDQAPAINFQVDDVDQAQQNPKLMAEGIRRGAYILQKKVDTTLAALWSQIGTSMNTAGTNGQGFLGTNAVPQPVGIGSSNEKNAYTALVDISTALTQTDTPEDGRFVVIPPWYYGLLLKDDRFVRYGTPFDVANLQKGVTRGFVGTVAGMSVYVSNNVSSTNSTTNFKIIGGHPFAWTLAMQLSKVEAYRMERRFADAIKALLLFGCKVIRVNNMVVHFATQGTL